MFPCRATSNKPWSYCAVCKLYTSLMQAYASLCKFNASFVKVMVLCLTRDVFSKIQYVVPSYPMNLRDRVCRASFLKEDAQYCYSKGC